MVERTTSPFFALGVDARRLTSDVVGMLQARRQLAELEVRADIASSKRLGITGGIGLVLTLTSLPVLVVALARALHCCLPIGGEAFSGWLLICGGALLLAGGGTLWYAWRRFRREFVGLRESIAELREDVVWLREWTERTGEDGD